MKLIKIVYKKCELLVGPSGTVSIYIKSKFYDKVANMSKAKHEIDNWNGIDECNHNECDSKCELE